MNAQDLQKMKGPELVSWFNKIIEETNPKGFKAVKRFSDHGKAIKRCEQLLALTKPPVTKEKKVNGNGKVAPPGILGELVGVLANTRKARAIQILLDAEGQQVLREELMKALYDGRTDKVGPLGAVISGIAKTLKKKKPDYEIYIKKDSIGLGPIAKG